MPQSRKQQCRTIGVAGNDTLFLDEIGEIAPTVQAKLSRALQERESRRVGAERNVNANARVVAGSNRDLRPAVDAGALPAASGGLLLAFFIVDNGGYLETMLDSNPPKEPVGTTRLDDVLSRIKGEYEEMPGMCVTPPQAQRLWGLDPATCELVLNALLDRGIVRKTRRGTYVKR